MAEFAVVSAFAYFGAHDFSGDIDQWAMNGTAEALRKTTFRSGGANIYKIGMKTTTMSMEGYADLAADGQDEHLFATYSGRTAGVVTIGNDETEGEPCCMTQQFVPSFTPGGGGQVGQMSRFSMQGQGTDVAGGVRGFLLKEQGAVSATGAIGTAVQLGPTSATQYRYATLHLLGTAGTSITVVLEMDNASNFPSATTVGTFGPLTASGGYWLTPVIGAASDEWYRFRVTACTGTWTVGGAAAIQ